MDLRSSDSSSSVNSSDDYYEAPRLNLADIPASKSPVDLRKSLIKRVFNFDKNEENTGQSTPDTTQSNKEPNFLPSSTPHPNRKLPRRKELSCSPIVPKLSPRKSARTNRSGVAQLESEDKLNTDNNSLTEENINKQRNHIIQGVKGTQTSFPTFVSEKLPNEENEVLPRHSRIPVRNTSRFTKNKQPCASTQTENPSRNNSQTEKPESLRRRTSKVRFESLPFSDNEDEVFENNKSVNESKQIANDVDQHKKNTQEVGKSPKDVSRKSSRSFQKENVHTNNSALVENDIEKNKSVEQHKEIVNEQAKKNTQERQSRISERVEEVSRKSSKFVEKENKSASVQNEIENNKSVDQSKEIVNDVEQGKKNTQERQSRSSERLKNVSRKSSRLVEEENELTNGSAIFENVIENHASVDKSKKVGNDLDQSKKKTPPKRQSRTSERLKDVTNNSVQNKQKSRLVDKENIHSSESDQSKEIVNDVEQGKKNTQERQTRISERLKDVSRKSSRLVEEENVLTNRSASFGNGIENNASVDKSKEIRKDLDQSKKTPPKRQSRTSKHLRDVSDNSVHNKQKSRLFDNENIHTIESALVQNRIETKNIATTSTSLRKSRSLDRVSYIKNTSTDQQSFNSIVKSVEQINTIESVAERLSIVPNKNNQDNFKRPKKASKAKSPIKTREINNKKRSEKSIVESPKNVEVINKKVDEKHKMNKNQEKALNNKIQHNDISTTTKTQTKVDMFGTCSSADSTANRTSGRVRKIRTFKDGYLVYALPDSIPQISLDFFTNNTFKGKKKRRTIVLKKISKANKSDLPEETVDEVPRKRGRARKIQEEDQVADDRSDVPAKKLKTSETPPTIEMENFNDDMFQVPISVAPKSKSKKKTQNTMKTQKVQ